jgi:NitT/TauT family transport system ATP-binding protein
VPPADRSLLRVSGLSKRFGNGREALRDVSFDVAAGELVAVVGPSGCGKTTLLRLVCGLTAPSDGTVTIGGRPVSLPPRETALVFQDYGRSLFPWLTVERNVAFGLRGLARAERRQRARSLLADLGLGDAARAYPWQLSGGMQQRVAIARALAPKPQILLLDEPFASVDALTRAELQDVLLRVHGGLDGHAVTVVHVTHDIDEAVYLADRVLVMQTRPGRIVRSLEVGLPRPRSQTETRSAPSFLAARHEIHALIGSEEVIR